MEFLAFTSYSAQRLYGGTVNVSDLHFSKSWESDHPLGMAQSGRLGRKTSEMSELEHLLSKTPELLSLRQV